MAWICLPKKKKLPKDFQKIQLGVEYSLEPKNSSVKSFYGKAGIIFEYSDDFGIQAVLQSYSTNIATCNRSGSVEKLMVVRDGLPQERKLTHTSARHFREFKAQAPQLAAIVETLIQRSKID